MVIDPFKAGVFCTLFAEMLLVIIIPIILQIWRRK